MSRPSQRVQIPTGRAAIAAMSDDKFLRDVLASDQIGEFMASYMDASAEEMPSFQRKVDEAAQSKIFAMARNGELGDLGRPHMGPAARKGGARSATAPHAHLDGIAASFGELCAAHAPSQRSTDNDRLVGAIRNAMGSTVPSDGGFAVGEEFRSELQTLALEESIVRGRATVWPMGSPTLAIPSVDEVTHGDGTVRGGVGVEWAAEGEPLTLTAPKFARIKLQANKMACFAEAPNELVADVAAFDRWILQTMGEAHGFAEDESFLNGDGVGKPLGVLHPKNAAAVTVAKEGSQPADTILWANLVKMHARLLPESHKRAVWVAHVSTFPQLAQLTVQVKNVAGTENVGGSAVWLPDGSGAAPLTLLGKPVIFTEKVPPLGDEGDISLVDLSFYWVGDRMQMVGLASEHFAFNRDSTAFRMTSRLDGRPGLLSPITPRYGTDTLSPFVKLAARA